MRRLSFLLALVLGGMAGADQQTVENGDDIKVRNATPFELGAHYDAALKKHSTARRTRVDALATPEEIAAYQQEKRDYFIDALGGFPERTPLNARVVGEGDGGDYRYEKIIYESQPGFYVTAVLFLPKGDGPFPGVLVPCGHSNNGKAAETYQRASILLAKNGMAALCYDPIGQGERYHFLKENGKPAFGTTLEHTLMGVGTILTGTNIAMYRIWDGMRGLDYLESRGDIDPERLACTGNSGGGTLTSYIMALDARVSVAAPSCYITNFDRLLDTIGPQDAEQDIFGQIANGLDHTEYIHLRAPKPTLLCAATHDFFDIEGTWATFREAKQVYTKLGFPERINLVEANEKHGFTKPLRQAMVQWMRRWLLDIDAPVVEPDFAIHSDAEMLCTPDGSVLALEGARSLFDLNAARNEMLAAKRAAIAQDNTPARLRQKIAALAGDSTVSAEDAPEVQARAIDAATPRIELTLAALPEDDKRQNLWVHARIFVSQELSRKYMTTALKGSKSALELDQDSGLYVITAEFGGLDRHWPEDNDQGWEGTAGARWKSYFRAYLLGENFLSFWIKDIVDATQSAQQIVEQLGSEAFPVVVHAKGWTTVPALHAAALHPGRIDQLILEGGIPSWSEVVATPRAKGQLLTTVHGALEVYDLPDLVALCPAGSVEIRDAKVPTF